MCLAIAIHNLKCVKITHIMYNFLETYPIYQIQYLFLFPIFLFKGNKKVEQKMYKQQIPKGFFRFEIIINVLVISFWLIWISMLWIYGHYKYFNSFSAGIVSIRQNLPSTDVIFWRMKTVPALKGLRVSDIIKIKYSSELDLIQCGDRL